MGASMAQLPFLAGGLDQQLWDYANALPPELLNYRSDQKQQATNAYNPPSPSYEPQPAPQPPQEQPLPPWYTQGGLRARLHPYAEQAAEAIRYYNPLPHAGGAV